MDYLSFTGLLSKVRKNKKRSSVVEKSKVLNGHCLSVTKILSTLGLVVVAGLLLIAAGCGGGKTAAVAPDALIKSYMAKHETMVDASLAGLYIEKEQAGVAEKVTTTIAARKADGSLEGLQGATFDFSGLQIQVVGEMEDYINDEIKQFLKVAVKGQYKMNVQESGKQISADQVLILEKEAGDWKITETINPWT